MDPSGEPHSHTVIQPTSYIRGEEAGKLIATLPPFMSTAETKKNSPNIQFVKEIYQILKNDLDDFLKLCDDNTSWTVNGPPVLSKCKNWIGTQGIKEFFNLLASMWIFDEKSPMPMEFYEDGNTIIVLGHESGTIIKTNERFYNRFTHIWEIDANSRKIRSMREWLCFYHSQEEVPPMEWASS